MFMSPLILAAGRTQGSVSSTDLLVSSASPRLETSVLTPSRIAILQAQGIARDDWKRGVKGVDGQGEQQRKRRRVFPDPGEEIYDVDEVSSSYDRLHKGVLIEVCLGHHIRDGPERHPTLHRRGKPSAAAWKVL